MRAWRVARWLPVALLAIIAQVAGAHDVQRITDRREAIAAAIAAAAAGDVVVIAGKGHEQGQEFENGRKEPFDDVTVAREALRSRLGAAA
jgi:UDP-N-acetylmuramoyl-L-alanyl-D-glutamate--2,6-diaminopimelate ligase